MIMVKAESMKKALGLCFIYTSNIRDCQEKERRITGEDVPLPVREALLPKTFMRKAIMSRRLLPLLQTYAD